MTINAHPYVWTVAAAQCQGEVLKICARERRAHLMAAPPDVRHPGTDHLVVEPVAWALARRLDDVRQTVFPLRSIELSCR
jgi:hypothetical protein